jgi:diaphanous 1
MLHNKRTLLEQNLALKKSNNIVNPTQKQENKNILQQNDKDINNNNHLTNGSSLRTNLRDSRLPPVVINGNEADLNKSPSSNGPSMNSSVNSDQSYQQSSSKGFFSSWFGLSSSTKVEGTPEFYIEKLLQKSISSKPLAERLQSLRVTLTTAKLSWIKDFIDGDGLAALECVLERYTTGTKKILSRNSDHDDRIQSECIRCLRVLLNTEVINL